MVTNTLPSINCFLCAYPHGERVMQLAWERVITCCVRAFTLFLEIPWRVTYNHVVENYVALERQWSDLNEFRVLEKLSLSKSCLFSTQSTSRTVSLLLYVCKVDKCIRQEVSN